MLVSGQWCLVTGASSGLGEELARQLAARGLSIVLTARSVRKLSALAAELGSTHGVGTRVVGADLATREGIDALIEATRSFEVPIDHLVGNAGFGTYGDLAEADPDELRAMVTINCEAIVALTRAFLPDMIARRRGGVIHVASAAAFQPTPMLATYAASKAFVLHLTEAVHEEVRGSGVRAMALCPGPVLTGFQARASIRIAPTQRAMVMSARETVRRGLADYERGCAVSVPGALNKLGALLGSMGPRLLVRRATHAILRTAVRGAR